MAEAPFAPELCRTESVPPAGDQWLHEIKWDGYRILCTVVGGQVRLWSRNGIEWTQKVPTIVEAVASLGLDSAQLDGELIALKGSKDDFNALQAGLSGSKAHLIYELFDAPYLAGRSLRKVPLIERKQALEAILTKHPHPLLRFSRHVVGHGDSVLANAIEHDHEGIVSKRADSPYSGKRTGNWVKVKARPSDEFVVVGFTDPKGGRTAIGALLLAEYREHRLVYVGRVGTGFSDNDLRELRTRLEKDVVDEPTADEALMGRADQRLAIWVKPKLVAEVFYLGRGGSGLLRQVAFKAIRADKTPATPKS